jgi:hypothetical protein
MTGKSLGSWLRFWIVPLSACALVVAIVASPFAYHYYFIHFVDPSGQDINDMRWEESVTLASGETVKVKRHIRFRQEEAFGMGLMAQNYLAASLEIVPAPKDFVVWNAPIIPILLDRDPANGEWVVIGGYDSSNLWDFNGKPCPPQWGFRLREGIWYIQPVPENLIGKKPNLLLDLRVSDDREFTLQEFSSEVVVRKKQQTAFGDRIIPGMRSVGEVYKPSPCEEPGPPRFTDEFTAIDPPNLVSFPRIP